SFCNLRLPRITPGNEMSRTLQDGTPSDLSQKETLMRMLVTTSGKSAGSPQTTAPNYEVIYETAAPCGDLGCWGPDVCQTQSVAVRFEPRSEYYLKRLGLWFMSNASPGEHPEVVVTLRNDKTQGSDSMPGDRILERWILKVTAHGWTPVREELES